MKRFYIFTMSVLTAAVALIGCSKSNETAGEPAVSAELISATTKTLTFSITPVNAVKCAWMVLASDANIPNAETILAEGVPAHANEASNVTESGLSAFTSYNFVVAVANADKKVSFYSLEAKTEDVPEVEFDSNRATGRKYGGSVTNFGITFNTEFDGVDHQLSLDVYDFENSGALCLKPGTYTVTDAHEGKTIGKEYSNILIDNNQYSLESGSVVVTLNEDKTYSIDFRFITNNPAEASFHGVFHGVISGLEVQ